MIKKISLFAVLIVVIIALVLVMKQKSRIQSPVRDSSDIQVVQSDDVSSNTVPDPVEDTEFMYSMWNEFGEHPLDKELVKCMTEDTPGTSGETECLRSFIDKWENDIAITSNLLTGPGFLDADTQDQFKRAQEQWQLYKEVEFNFIEKKYEGSDGTMYPRLIAGEQMMMMRHRAFELGGYYQTLIAERG